MPTSMPSQAVLMTSAVLPRTISEWVSFEQSSQHNPLAADSYMFSVFKKINFVYESL
jgi:hypothetical protein